MDAFVESFIETGKGEDYRKLDDLQLDVVYKIVEFTLKKSVSTYGAALEVQVEDPETSRTFFCYFPERFAKKIKTDEELKHLNEQNLSFKFQGRVNKVAILEFIKPN